VVVQIKEEVESTELALAFLLADGDIMALPQKQPVFAFLPLRRFGFRFIVQGELSRKALDIYICMLSVSLFVCISLCLFVSLSLSLCLCLSLRLSLCMCQSLSFSLSLSLCLSVSISLCLSLDSNFLLDDITLLCFSLWQRHVKHDGDSNSHLKTHLKESS